MPATSVEVPYVSFVVPTYRRPDVLPETLEALLRQDYPGDRYEIIVVDDGSGDETPDLVGRYAGVTPVVRYQGQPNSGVALARNEGARVARGEVLVFVDDDIVVPPGLIRAHLRRLAEFAPCLVNGRWDFSPALANALRATPFGRFRIRVEDWVKSGLAKNPLGSDCLEPAAVTACNLAVRRDDFWRVGGFDEEFPYAGCEDQEFSIRAAKAGYRFVYDPEMVVWHNDRRLSLRQFCERQRRGAITLALLASKHPEKRSHPTIEANTAIRRNDPLGRVVKKAIKRLASSPPVLAALHGTVSVLERLVPMDRLLARWYWAMCGLYIFAGVREGMSRFEGSAVNPAGAHPEGGAASARERA